MVRRHPHLPGPPALGATDLRQQPVDKLAGVLR